MGTLNVWFQGVCTHFRNTVPGIPHRVVLPDASAMQFGFVEFPPSIQFRGYFLMPHFAILRTRPDQDVQLNLPGLMTSGNVYDGIRLQVANAVDQALTYHEDAEHRLPSIRHYVSHYAYADEVVVGGRAVCYFDLFGGLVQFEQTHSGAWRTIVTIQTDGPPELLVTPIVPTEVSHQRITLPGEGELTHLLVANLGINCEREDAYFDFLLHYLTAKGGIPRRFEHRTPGLTEAPPLQDFSAAVTTLSAMNFPEIFTGTCFGPFGSHVLGELSPACSNTTYP